MGYKKKRSKDSLVASSIITGLLLISAVLMGRPDTTYGVRLALGSPTSGSPNLHQFSSLYLQALHNCAQSLPDTKADHALRCTTGKLYTTRDCSVFRAR